AAGRDGARRRQRQPLAGNSRQRAETDLSEMGRECAQKLGSQRRGYRDVPSRSLLVAPQIKLFTPSDDALDIAPACGARRHHSVRRVTYLAAGFAQQHGQAGITIAKDRVDSAFRSAGVSEALA